MATASRAKATAMVFSRPTWSETQPKKGRVRPLVIRSKVSAKGSAAKPNTIASATPNSLAKAANCATTIRPPVDIIAIMANISQKSGLRSISAGATSRAALAALSAGMAGVSPAFGVRRPRAAATPMTAMTAPNTNSVWR